MKIKDKHSKQTDKNLFQNCMPYIIFLCFISQALSQPWGSLYGNKGDVHVTNKDRSNKKAGYVIRGNQDAWWIYKNGPNLDFNFANSTGDTHRGVMVARINSSTGAIHTKHRVKVGAGTGNGFALWGGGDGYKIHMGNTSEYHYGGVTDFAIKTNMDDHEGRGWVWGANNQTPVAALTNTGSLRLAENLQVKELESFNLIANKRIVADNVILFGSDCGLNFWNDDESNFKISMGYDASYRYGAVTNKSIKTKMSGLGRGFTWGHMDEPPIASLSNTGIFQIKNDFIAEGDAYTKKMHIGEEVSNAIDNVKLSIDGRLYISENDSKGEGFDDVTHKNYEDYLIWIEEGVASSNLALSNVDNWPDYVFDSEYELPSLKQIENTILEKGHLHTMPSAEEVAKKGFTIGDMTKRMLQTIEELTLHIISQENKLDDLLARSEVLIEKH
ncbi:MAG: hypothetical protein ACPH2K_03155 [Flavicella sp.]